VILAPLNFDLPA